VATLKSKRDKREREKGKAHISRVDRNSSKFFFWSATPTFRPFGKDVNLLLRISPFWNVRRLAFSGKWKEKRGKENSQKQSLRRSKKKGGGGACCHKPSPFLLFFSCGGRATMVLFRARVPAGLRGDQADEMPLRVGDIVYRTSVAADGRWAGVNLSSDACGLFAADVVEPLVLPGPKGKACGSPGSKRPSPRAGPEISLDDIVDRREELKRLQADLGSVGQQTASEVQEHKLLCARFGLILAVANAQFAPAMWYLQFYVAAWTCMGEGLVLCLCTLLLYRDVLGNETFTHAILTQYATATLRMSYGLGPQVYILPMFAGIPVIAALLARKVRPIAVWGAISCVLIMLVASTPTDIRRRLVVVGVGGTELALLNAALSVSLVCVIAMLSWLALTDILGAQVARTRWLNTLSHDIRTPLHGLLSAIDDLEEEYLPDEQRELISITKMCAEVLRDILSNVLSFSSFARATTPIAARRDLDEGHDESMWSVVNLPDFALRQKSVVRGLAPELRAHVAVDPSAPTRCAIPTASLQQVLTNLIGNSAKFAPGKSSISIFFEGFQKSGQGHLRVIVEDEGPGVPKELRDRIFEPFERGPDHYQSVEGAGLGLSICKEVLATVDGSISCQPRRDGKTGAGFVCELALRDPDNIEDGDAADSNDSASDSLNLAEIFPRVLILDDNELNLVVLQRHLLKLGIKEVLRTTRGDVALEMLVENPDVSLCLTDIAMPEMDGFEFARRARKLQRGPDTHFFAIACTGQSSETIIEDIRGAGISAVLQKPFLASDLEQTLRRLARKTV
jgi:signal transduction histidine kinase